MSLIDWIRQHRGTLLFVVAALAFAGAYAAVQLPVGLFPQVSFPRIVVSVESGDRPADQTALLVTTPIEQAVRRVPGIQEVRSISSRGAAEVSINFGWGLDMVSTTLQVDAAIAQILHVLPPGTTYLVRRMDPTAYPIIGYSLTSPTVSQIALRELAQYRLLPLLSAIPGVARVDVQGGAQEEVQVLVDPARLQTYGLALSDVAHALGAANVLTAVGRLEDHYKLFLLLSDQGLHKMDQIKAVVVAASDRGVVRLGDVAEVVDGVVPQWVRVDANGHPAVLFQVYEQPDGNSVQIAGAVRSALDKFMPHLPTGVTLSNWYDQSILVTQSAASVRDAILIGLLFAGLILLVFLRNFRITLVAMLLVPATLAMTLLALNLMGLSFNIMTLGGIAAAVGLIIDDVIVMIEHIVRRVGEAAAATNQVRAVLAAAREFWVPLSGSSLATVIVFFPLAFLTGVSGTFFKALSITMAIALFISFVLTAVAVPLLVNGIVDFSRWQQPTTDQAGRFASLHRKLLERLLNRPWLVGFAVAPLLVIGWVAYSHVGTGFLPAMDEGGFIIDYRTPPGTALSETDRTVREVEAILKSTPDVQSFSRRTGLGLGGDFNEANQGDFFVRLKATGRRPIDQVMAEVRQKIQRGIPGLQVEFAQLLDDLIGDLTAVPQPIEVKLFSADPSQLIPEARKIAALVSKVPGVVDVKNGVVLAGDALDIDVDPAKAALEGMDPDTVSQTLNAYLAGTIATELPETIKKVGVRVLLSSSLRSRDSDLGRLMIRAPDGHMFPLSRVATVTSDPGQPQIMRDNLLQMVAVTARISDRDIGSTVTDVRQALDRPDFLDPGVTYELGGLYQQQQIAFAGLTRVFLAALAAEFILLLFLYGQVTTAIVILLSSLLSTSAVFVALWLTGVDLNITAMMGMTMVIGIATEMAIFYVSEYRELVQTMPVREALIEASQIGRASCRVRV